MARVFVVVTDTGGYVKETGERIPPGELHFESAGAYKEWRAAGNILSDVRFSGTKELFKEELEAKEERAAEEEFKREAAAGITPPGVTESYKEKFIPVKEAPPPKVITTRVEQMGILTETPERKLEFGERLTSKAIEFEVTAKARRSEFGSGGYEIAAFGLGAAGAVATIFRHPIRTVVGSVKSAFHPIETAKSIKAQAARSPFTTLGEFTGQIALFKSFKGVKHIRDITRTTGRVKIPQEKLITKEVLTGEKRFPVAGAKEASVAARAKLHEKLFLEQQYGLPGSKKPGGFHAAPEPLTDLKILKGASELEGLYIAPSISPHFLKLTAAEGFKIPSPKEVFKGLKSPIGKPQVLYVEPKRFVKGKKAKVGEAAVPGIKTEIEAIIPPETLLEPTGKRFYFEFEGRRVPIDEFRTVGKGRAKKLTLGKEMKTFEQLSSEYTLPSSTGFSKYFKSLPSFKSSLGKSTSRVSKVITSSIIKGRPSKSQALPRSSPFVYGISKRYVPKISESFALGVSRAAPYAGYNIFIPAKGVIPGATKTLLPRIKQPDKPKKLTKAQKRRIGKGAYTPSGRALFFEIKGLPVEEGITGLGERPLIARSRKKK